MILEFNTLKDKILGCWNGKNIGGVLGAPLEGKRGVFDVDFYLQENLDKNPPPNDDLDLQIVWLGAAEKYGQQLTADILGEYWLTLITPNWNEYGRGKANLRGGLQPPLCGYVDNSYKNSCGCFIRSEIWACLAPGNPALAVKYAYEDAVIDHGTDGMYGELFCAALESAAFAEHDRDTLIAIGLSYIPKDCLVAKAVKLAIECHQDGLTWQEARLRMMNEVPGTFGLQNGVSANAEGFPLEPVGNDAPNNIGLMMIGWLYGDGDFGKSLCIATNCGEDTDCTAGTLGAILGILLGDSGLPEKWAAPIGGVINTNCIETTCASLIGGIPASVDELSDRILRTIPRFLDRQQCDLLAEDGYTVKTAEDFFCHDREQRYLPGIGGNVEPYSVIGHEQFSPLTIRKDFHMFHLYLDHIDGVYLSPGRPTRLRLTVRATEHSYQQWLNVQVYTPDWMQVQPGRCLSAPLQCTHYSPSVFEITLTAEEIKAGYADVLIDVSAEGRHTYGVIKTRLYLKG